LHRSKLIPEQKNLSLSAIPEGSPEMPKFHMILPGVQVGKEFGMGVTFTRVHNIQ
jgi:hypothetical protein